MFLLLFVTLFRLPSKLLPDPASCQACLPTTNFLFSQSKFPFQDCCSPLTFTRKILEWKMCTKTFWEYHSGNRGPQNVVLDPERQDGGARFGKEKREA